MKKILIGLSVFSLSFAFADEMNMGSNDGKIRNMYVDFGIGSGNARDFDYNSWALNAMTMGFVVNKYLAAEVGMDVLPDGTNGRVNPSTGKTWGGEAMVMSYHVAAKAMYPVNQYFVPYGKLGFGFNQYEGEVNTKPGMVMDNGASLGVYYGAGVMTNINRYIGFYAEASGVAVPNIGQNGEASNGSFGSTFMGTLGVEIGF